MRQVWTRLAGLALLVGAVIGISLSVAGLILVWVEAPRLEAKINQLFDLGGRTLDTTQSGLAVISTSLDQSQQSVRLMETTADDIGIQLDQTVPMVRSAAGLVGKDMTGVIQNTQTSLDSARASARFIDDTLNLIASLPLIGQRYSPNASLSNSIDQVSKSLEGLPGSLSDLQSNLNTSADNLKTIRSQVQALSGDIHAMDASLGEAKSVVGRYQAQVSELQVDLGRARQELPAAMLIAKAAGSLFFIWLALAQIGMVLQGRELLGTPHEQVVTEVDVVEIQEMEERT